MKLFVLQGRHDCGKTETLTKVIDILDNKYPGQKQVLVNGNDKIVIFNNIKGFKVGIETQGDPNSRLEKSLSDFQKNKCDIIFCACRTRGSTVEIIESYRVPKNTIKYIKQNIVSNGFSKNNLIMATNLVNLAGL